MTDIHNSTARQTQPYERQYVQPRLLMLGNKVTDGVCTKECPNLFVSSESCWWIETVNNICEYSLAFKENFKNVFIYFIKSS